MRKLPPANDSRLAASRVTKLGEQVVDRMTGGACGTGGFIMKSDYIKAAIRNGHGEARVPAPAHELAQMMAISYCMVRERQFERRVLKGSIPVLPEAEFLRPTIVS